MAKSVANPKRAVTMAEVAAKAGVDQSVVSRVLRDDTSLNIRESTRERVLQAVRELGYRPNSFARSLRTAKAAAYGLLIPDFANPIYASIIKGAENAASARSCLLLTGSTSEDLFRTRGMLEGLFHGRIDGLLITGEQTLVQMGPDLARIGLPWLMLNRGQGSDRYVILDDERAAEIAVDYLIQMGHRQIAHIAGPDWADTATRRKQGYQNALARAGLAQYPSYIENADYTSKGGDAAMAKLLESAQPTAVFVANIASAIGAIHSAKRLGYRVPQDLSFVAVHDLPLAGYLDPPLTTVRMPLEELGRRGVELLASYDADSPIQEVLRDPIELVVRGSVAPPKDQP